VIVVAFLGFVATRPNTYHVERSAVVAAPADVVYPELVTLEGFTHWSPWEHRDPAMKKQFTGPKEGVGQVYSWQGTDKVGEGEMKIIAIDPASVKSTVHFMKPFDSTSTITWSVVPDGAGSKVTWAMDGDANFGAKLMGVFTSMDKMIGSDFDEGLANLQKVALADQAKAAADKAAADKAAADAAAAKASAPPDAPPPAPGATVPVAPAKG
jgi:hypothetical protein